MEPTTTPPPASSSVPMIPAPWLSPPAAAVVPFVPTTRAATPPRDPTPDPPSSPVAPATPTTPLRRSTRLSSTPPRSGGGIRESDVHAAAMGRGRRPATDRHVTTTRGSARPSPAGGSRNRGAESSTPSSSSRQSWSKRPKTMANDKEADHVPFDAAAADGSVPARIDHHDDDASAVASTAMTNTTAMTRTDPPPSVVVVVAHHSAAVMDATLPSRPADDEDDHRPDPVPPVPASVSTMEPVPRLVRSYAYPTDDAVPVPSRNMVESLHHHALQEETPSDGETDLARLARAGVLSLERVLLPAIAAAEDEALKHVQAMVQRDGRRVVRDGHPTITASTPLDDEGRYWQAQLVACRAAVYTATSAAMQAVAKQRTQHRLPAEQVRVQNEWIPARDAQRAQQQADRDAARAAARQRRSQQLPYNQALWREVAYLMTEQSKLAKEERAWLQAQRTLVETTEPALRQREAAAAAAETAARDTGSDQENHPHTALVTSVAHQEKIAALTHTVDAIRLSSVRLQRALRHGTQLVAASDATRRELYQRYRRDLQFRHYPGVHDAPGLLKALSQPTPAQQTQESGGGHGDPPEPSQSSVSQSSVSGISHSD